MFRNALVFGLIGVSGLAPFALASGDAARAEAPPPETIVITVPAEDLARCIATLQQVFLGPVIGAEVQSASLSADQAGPIVRCEAE